MPYELIIFDCDGTLVDSEHMYNAITSEMLNELGYHEYTPEVCTALFCGQSWGNIRSSLEEKHGEAIPEDIVERYTMLSRARMDEDLTAVSGALSLVERARNEYKICVASNGEITNVNKSLSLTGFMDHFHPDHIFTKCAVENAKPAPDLFIHVADIMGVAPADTLVIEDSIAGVSAAIAANMDVIGFTGSAHDSAHQETMLRKAGAVHISKEFIHIANKLEKLKP